MDEADNPDAFQAPAVAEPKKAAYVAAPLPGGTLPDVGLLFSETIAEFTDKIGPYIMAGLGLTVVVVPVSFLMIIVMYVLMFGGMFGVMMGGVVVGVGVSEAVNEDLGALVMVLSQFLSVAVMIGAFMLCIGLMVSLLAPLNASLARAVAEQQRGGKELEFTSVFSSIGQDLFKVVSAAGMISTLSVIGAMACYFPALIVLFVLGFATSLVALHRLRPLEAIRANLAHAKAHLQWHLVFGMMYFAILMVASYIPILGAMFVVALHVRAYRTMFGDGDEPVLQVV